MAAVIPWKPEDKLRLIALWTSGVGTRAIADELGITKNAAIGMVHRMELPGRASPILRGPVQDAATEDATRLARAGHGVSEIVTRTAVGWNRAQRMVSAARAAMPVAAEVPALSDHPQEPVPEPMPDEPPPVPSPVDAPEPLVARVARPAFPAACCWPIGSPRTAGFRYCDDRTALGKSYCDAHARIAYMPSRHREAVA